MLFHVIPNHMYDIIETDDPTRRGTMSCRRTDLPLAWPRALVHVARVYPEANDTRGQGTFNVPLQNNLTIHHLL